MIQTTQYRQLQPEDRMTMAVVKQQRSPMDARRVYSTPTDRITGVISDQKVMLNGYYSARKYPEHLRRIRFKDPETGRTPIFLTNNAALPARTIAAL